MTRSTHAPISLRAALRALSLAEPAVSAQLGQSPRLAWSIPEARAPFPAPGGRPWLWLHAASGGDVRALRATARHLRAARPNARLHLTVVTPTGYEAGLEAQREGWLDAVAAAPITMPGAIARQWPGPPRAAIIERLELWPALLAPLARHRVPWVLHNARLSARSAAAYQAVAPGWWPWLTRDLRLVLAQDAATIDRLIRLAPALAGRARVAPSPKVAASVAPAPEQVERLRARYRLPVGRRCLVAGSVHEAELERALVGHDGRPLLIAPRYPERAADIARRVRSLGLAASLASEPGASQVTVLDRFGELPALYGLARWSLIGGTLCGRGGHNPLEALVAGSPVVVGESIEAIEALLEPFRGVAGAVVEHGARPGWPEVQREPPPPEALADRVARWRDAIGSWVGVAVLEALDGVS